MNSHALVRSLTLTHIIELIQHKYMLSENQALKMFYTSGIGYLFSDDDTGLYGQSAYYIFSLLEEEQTP